MAALYTRVADRRRLVKEAMNKLGGNAAGTKEPRTSVKGAGFAAKSASVSTL